MVWRSLLVHYDVISVLAIRAKLAFLLIKVVSDLPILYRLSLCALIHSDTTYERFELYLKDLS